MIYICKPSKMAIYINPNRKTAAQVKAETGCAALINAGFFNMSTFKPVFHLKVDGEVLASEASSYWGYAWDTGKANVVMTGDYSDYDNYICAIVLVKDGAPQLLARDPAWDGARRRTAIGLYPDGRIWLHCSDALITPEKLRQMALDAGLDSAIMLDGGASTQCVFPDGSVTGGRIVQNYICVWKEQPKMKICLDPGHGLLELNQSPDGTYFEHEFALDMGNRIRKHLQWHGLDVLLTREDSSTPALAARANMANSWGADLYVSLHSNAVNGGWMSPSGLTVWTYAAGGERDRAAKLMLDEAKAVGVKTFGSELYHSNFTVLALTSMPAYLIEYAFHTNKGDVALLKSADHRAKLAEITARAIVHWCGSAWIPESVSKEDGTIYRVQTGAFVDESNAERMTETLRAQGYQTIIKAEDK